MDGVIFKTKLMEQIRFYGQSHCPSIFDPNDENQPPVKIGTEVFDCTLPSELEFQDENAQGVQKNRGQFLLFENKVEEEKAEVSVLGEIMKNSTPAPVKAQPSQYEMLTNAIATFTFHKSGTVVFGQPEYAKGSYIPHFLKIKTFPVKFRDEDSQLSNGISKLQLLWKNVVGYIKVELYVNAGAIYLLQRRPEGFLVKTAWSLEGLFKVFSDREERKARIIFRVTDQGQHKLKTKEFQEVDLNLLASLLTEAGNSFDITSA